VGWFDGFKRIKDPVRGSAQIVSTTRAPHNATSGNCRMHLVVSVPGHQAFAIDDEFIVRVKKWPSPGQTLPIVASQSDPTRFKILWDELPSWESQASAQAAQLAAAMNQQEPPPTGDGQPTYQPYNPQPGPGSPTVMINGRPASPEEVQQAEAMTGLDLDGDGRIAGGAPAGTDRPGTVDDRVAALERLAALKDGGVLTDAEFEAEKARILDS
jgi:hypothetical protein